METWCFRSPSRRYRRELESLPPGPCSSSSERDTGTWPGSGLRFDIWCGIAGTGEFRLSLYPVPASGQLLASLDQCPFLALSLSSGLGLEVTGRVQRGPVRPRRLQITRGTALSMLTWRTEEGVVNTLWAPLLFLQTACLWGLPSWGPQFQSHTPEDLSLVERGPLWLPPFQGTFRGWLSGGCWKLTSI